MWWEILRPSTEKERGTKHTMTGKTTTRTMVTMEKEEVAMSLRGAQVSCLESEVAEASRLLEWEAALPKYRQEEEGRSGGVKD
jgi:hypothetical protein